MLLSVIRRREAHLGARRDPQVVGRRALVEAEREQPVRVDHESDLAGAERSERLDAASDPTVARDADGDSVTELVDLVRVDVELRVAEPVDPQHLADDGVAFPARERDDAGREQVEVDRLAELLRSTPLDRCAAAGANTSRPAKVGPGAGSW